MVGWIDLTASTSPTLAKLREGPGGDRLGIRHLVQGISRRGPNASCATVDVGPQWPRSQVRVFDLITNSKRSNIKHDGALAFARLTVDQVQRE